MKKQSHVMAFYHADGFVPAWKQATRFARKDGRLAVLPDIFATRLATKPGEEPWEMYFTTLSAEYFGVSRGGNLIIVVAHGVGPMSTLDGILKAYSWQFNDKSRSRRGGRISQDDFWKLESGAYGDVQIVDFDSYVRRYQYPFIGHLRFSQAMTDSLLHARFGPRAQEYLGRHLEEARKWHAEQAGIDPENRYKLDGHAAFCDRRRAMHARLSQPDSDPYIVQIADDSNCSYQYYRFEPGMAAAHLLSVSQLQHMHHSEEGQEFRQYESLTFDVSCHGWNNGVRLLSVRKDAALNAIHAGPDVHDMVRRHWRRLLVPVVNEPEIGFRPLIKVGDEWFVQYLKNGAGLDTYEPEFHVTSIKPMGDAVEFVTDTLGYYGFFKYDIRGVQAMAPKGANAYALAGEPVNINGAEQQRCPIQFYRVEADTSKRIRRRGDLENDYETLMKLVASGGASE